MDGNAKECELVNLYEKGGLMSEHAKTCKHGIKNGENHGRAKLLDSEVEIIRANVEAGVWTQAEAAAIMEISKAQISNIVNYRQR
jgi:predicted DNA-binding protein (UPF0251 family)